MAPPKPVSHDYLLYGLSPYVRVWYRVAKRAYASHLLFIRTDHPKALELFPYDTFPILAEFVVDPLRAFTLLEDAVHNVLVFEGGVCTTEPLVKRLFHRARVAFDSPFDWSKIPEYMLLDKCPDGVLSFVVGGGQVPATSTTSYDTEGEKNAGIV